MNGKLEQWSSDYEAALARAVAMLPHHVYTRGGNIARRRAAMEEATAWCVERLGEMALYLDDEHRWQFRDGAAWSIDSSQFLFHDADTAFEFKMRFG